MINKGNNTETVSDTRDPTPVEEKKNSSHKRDLTEPVEKKRDLTTH